MGAAALIDRALRALFQRRMLTGPDGAERVLIEEGEGEFVCAACDAIIIAMSPPRHCPSCRSERIETLTAVRTAVPQGAAHG